MKFISLLLPLATQLGAVLLVSCLDNGSKETSPDLAVRINNALHNLSTEEHPRINYTVKHSGQIKVLDDLYNHGETGILAVINRPGNFFDKILHENGDAARGDQLTVPLLVFKG